jgi:hypothetical protein
MGHVVRYHPVTLISNHVQSLWPLEHWSRNFDSLVGVRVFLCYSMTVYALQWPDSPSVVSLL